MSAMFAAASRLGRNPVFVLALVSIVLALILAGFKWQRVSGLGVEMFAVGARLPSNWKGPKTPLVAMNGLHWFFSDGSLARNAEELSKHVAFLPSEKDTLCFYTKQGVAMPDVIKYKSVEVVCREVLPQEFSVRDDRRIAASVMCSNGVLDLPPLDLRDAEMRILNASYYFHKRCMTLKGVQLRRSSTRSQPGRLVMLLEPGEYTTKVFALLRPVLVNSLNSEIYTVSYAATGDYEGIDNSMVAYNSASKEKLQVVLTPAQPFKFEGKMHTLSKRAVTGVSIADDAVSTLSAVSEAAKRPNGAPLRHARTGTVAADALMLNLHYASPKESLVEAQRKPAQGFTCVFRNPTNGTQPAGGAELFNQELRVLVTAQKDATATNTVTVSRGSSVGRLHGVPLDATLVIGYAYNLVVVAAMSPSTGAVLIRRFSAFPVLDAAEGFDGPLHKALLGVKSASGLEYSVFALPNLLHLALDLRLNL